MHLLNGSSVLGYIRWHPYDQDSTLPIDSLLPEAKRKSWPLVIYADSSLVALQYVDSGLIVATDAPLSLSADSVTAIEDSPGALDGRDYYWGPARVARRQIALLQTKPVAMCWGANTEQGTTVIWLAYNSNITVEDLRPLCREPLIYLVAPAHGSENTDLIRLDIPDD